MSEPLKFRSGRALAGKRIVVSGSSQGIGRAVALRLGQEGARVVVNGSGLGPGGREASERTLEALAGEIESLAGEAAFFVGSVADEEQAAGLIETAVSRFGGLDGLVNCAGIPEPQGASILEISPADWRAVVAVHLDGTLHCCRYAAPHLVAAGGGAIVNTSSHAHLGVYGGTAYAAAKGAINSLTWAIAADLRERGVRCNAICPGAKTRLSTGAEHEARIAGLEARGLLSPLLAQNSLNAPPPAGCASLYATLLSDAARKISGQIFSASGPYVGVFPQSEDRFLAYKQPSEPEAASEAARTAEVHGIWQIEELASILLEKLEE